MKIFIKISFFSLTALFLMLQAQVCFSETKAGLTLLAGEKKLELSEKELLELGGAGSIETFSPGLQNKFGAMDIVHNFYGQKSKQPPLPQFYKNSPEKIYNLLKKFSLEVNVPVIEPELEIENNKAVKFTPPQNGANLNIYENMLLILEALEKNQAQISLQIDQTFPQKKLNSTNSLGINELLAIGESNFKGSPKNRRHNIAVGVEKFKGVIIQKDEEFSFNKNLGPVEAENGFLPELVIKKTGTVPELGGGLCQVSTTTFRAVMLAGLPVSQRKNHAYAVQYYSPQGTDATIYPGVIDLKFINDTSGAILIWPYLKDKDNLAFEFYGTKDSRQVTIEKPVQYDRLPDGSMKAYWNRTVVKDGVEKKDNFKSVYASPALFHKQEEFVKTDGTVSGLRMPQ